MEGAEFTCSVMAPPMYSLPCVQTVSRDRADPQSIKSNKQVARTGARGGSSGITELPHLKLLEGDFGPRTLTTLPQCFIFIELAHLDHLVLHQGES